MKITIESTDQITHLDGVPVRVWKGTMERAIECFVFVHRIAVREAAEQFLFKEELKEQLPPGRVVDLRQVL